jgi:ATP sulfurylase
MKHGYEDWDLWVSFVELGFKPYRIDEVLFYYRKCKEATRSTQCHQKELEMRYEIQKRRPNLYIDVLIKVNKK